MGTCSSHNNDQYNDFYIRRFRQCCVRYLHDHPTIPDDKWMYYDCSMTCPVVYDHPVHITTSTREIFVHYRVGTLRATMVTAQIENNI